LKTIFDTNALNDLFAISDNHYETTTMRVIDKLRLKFGDDNKLNYCRFIFTRNKLLKDSLILNLFCFINMEQAYYFTSNYEDTYNRFILSPEAFRLTYYDDRKGNIDKAKVIYLQGFNGNRNNNDKFFNQEYLESNVKYVNMQLYPETIILKEAEQMVDTFKYNSIRDCMISLIDSKAIFPKSNGNKCCVQFNIDFNNFGNHLIYICSYRTEMSQCNLEIKHIQEVAIQRCSKDLYFDIENAFNNEINIREYILSKMFN
jgi:hypothetical protein